MFSLAQLIESGLTASTVHKRTATGRLYRIHRGVYSLIPPKLLSRQGRYLAAVLACGPGAVLSYRSAAALHDLRASNRATIDVTVPCRTGHSQPGVQVHRSKTLGPADVTTVDGIPCTTIARTLLDLAAVLSERGLERVFERAEHLERLDARPLRDHLRRHPFWPGAARIRDLLDHSLSVPAEPELEERFLALCRRARLPEPERQVYVDPGDGEPMIRAGFHVARAGADRRDRRSCHPWHTPFV